MWSVALESCRTVGVAVLLQGLQYETGALIRSQGRGMFLNSLCMRF